MESLKPISLKQPLIITALILLFLIWGINTLNTGNPLWFFSSAQATYTPSRIILRHYGTTITIGPDDEHFAEITAALNESLSNFRNTDLVSLGLSEGTLQRYYEEEFIMEIYYPQPIVFNTSVRMSNVTQLLIPIDGRHDGQGYVFMGSENRWLAGAMQMRDPEPLLGTLRELGYFTE